ncbi:hypothetical protein [Enterococcus sp. RIT-PI-f]|uniref:hypothetical protein n=1 Tax=Enterococcus sp. RIT-PI-f TaxID=1690244 RepID=UPI001F47EDBC|nr:hypothetical protein [Enterococcus sp. RIT-PI-f]
MLHICDCKESFKQNLFTDGLLCLSQKNIHQVLNQQLDFGMLVVGMAKVPRHSDHRSIDTNAANFGAFSTE